MGADYSRTVQTDVSKEELLFESLGPTGLKKIKETFNKNPSYRIDKNALKSITNLSQNTINTLFDYFDMDANGTIDSYEFICATAMLCHASRELRAELLFKIYDTDNSGYLDKNKLKHLCRTLFLAKNRNAGEEDIKNKADEMIRDGDQDNDRRLNLREFLSYASKNRELFFIFDTYVSLLENYPQEDDDAPSGKKKKRKVVAAADDEGEEGEVDYVDDEEGIADHYTEDELDPDLKAELYKDSQDDERTEDRLNIKKGIEYEGGFKEEAADEGDQFGALKPWITNVVNSVPSNYRPSKLDGQLPDAQLELEWVHGYRCHDTRNNLRYNIDGDIVYHTAAVGIVYNKDRHEQKFLNEHFDDITALAIHPNRKYVATGEIGPMPLITVWDTTEDCKALVRIREPLQKGINHLAFSKDGKYLVATAADDNHNLAIFDWQKGTAEDLSSITNHRLKPKKGQAQCKGPVYATCETGKANILGVCFNKDATTIALACVKQIGIITVAQGKLKVKKATGLRGDNLTYIYCCGYLNNTLLCGTANGKLLVLAGTAVSKTIKGHTAAINSLMIMEGNIGFITGGADGMVLVWDSKYNVNKRISIKAEDVGSFNYRVRSVDQDLNGNILVGTRGGEIIEVINDVPNIVLRGHWDGELWGLCVDPKEEVYYTVGEDKMLGVWDVKTRKLKQKVLLDEAATSIDISPDGTLLAIGCDNANLYIYDAKSLKKKGTKKKESVQQSIEEIKFSPCGNFLAVGGIDKDKDAFSHIFIYDVKKNFKLLKKMKGHTSRITHIDWSKDSEYVQSNSSSYELLYHSVDSGTQITKPSAMRDTEWNGWTCVLGWPVQGIWPECASGDDINSCDVDRTGNYMVTADDYSKVKLFRYPSPVEKAAFNQYNGHSSHVTCIKFTAKNKYVISTGGNDKAIFQFKFTIDKEAADEEANYDEIDDDAGNIDEQAEAYFKEEEMMEGTEFGASRPWIGEMLASSPKENLGKNAGKKPPQGLKKLKYVFGYRAFDCRNNVYYTNNPDVIVY
ncbi:MAG: EF-hand domain-containing protein, partial [archaeon]|nr:EF-hand domain-containing protein [archaeon]